MALTEEQIKAKEEELTKREEELAAKEKASATAAIDTSKLSDEQINKVLEDPRIWKTQRLKELREKAKKLDDLEEETKKKEEEEAKKKGEFEKLLEEQKAENAKLQESIKQGKIDNAITAAAVKAGAVDPNVVAKLIDRSGITIGEDGTVSGIDEIVTKMLEDSPYLKGKPQAPVIGAPSNPGGDQQSPKTFKASQIQDPKFFKEHEAEITEAMATGKIEDDIAPQS